MAVDKSLKAVSASFKVGWKVEGNWTDPVLFTGFLVLRPLFTSFVGVFAYVFIGTVTGGFTPDNLRYITFWEAPFS